MTEQGADRKVRSVGWKARPLLEWLNHSLSLGAIAAILAIIGVAAALFVAAGGVDVSADKPDGWVSRHLLHFVFKRSEAARATGVVPPADLSAPSRVRLAAQHFDMVCANCHGRPGFGQSVVALSLSPRPQYLPKVVGQFTDPELYMIVQHGVKYSGMPSWPTRTREDEVWSMVAFLRQLPKLDAKAYADLTRLPQDASAGSPSFPAAAGDPILKAANPRRNTPPFDEFQYAAPSSGFSDETIHQTPVITCARCHGLDGSGAATGGEAPNLTLQGPAYLQAALDAYTRGSRKSGFMQNIAAQLSEAQIAALAHYYAGLPVKATSGPPADPALVKRGEMIAAEGIPQTATPACSSCHESDGGALIGAPHIAGQSQTFLRRELVAMRHGGRGTTVGWNPMPAVAHDLSDKDIAALAAYYAQLKPAKASGGAPPQTIAYATLAAQPRPADLAAAKHIFQSTCVKCHGDDGRGDRQGNYPNLTLQAAPFVAQNLYAFHSGARPSDKMRQVTEGLSFEQMKSLANYLNSLPPQRALAVPDPAAASRGAALALRGIPARGVPACLSCHGQTGVAALPLIPRLQGQNVTYLRNRLAGFSQPYAANLSALNPMPSIASKLTDQERADLAAYFAAAAPLQKSAVRP